MKVFELLENNIPLLTDVLLEKCKPFLGEAKSSIIVRGFYRTEDLGEDVSEATTSAGRIVKCYTVKVRKDREPANTDWKVHSIADGWFKSKFGWGARSQAMFAVGSKAIKAAEEYGYAKAVFPIGDFKVVWSPVYDDLYNAFSAAGFRFKDGTINDDRVIEILENGNYKSTGLQEAIKSGHELMIGCDSYLAVSLDRNLKTDLAKALK